MQTLAGTEVGFGRTRETAEEGVYKVAIEYVEEAVGKACLEAARELCLAAVHDRPFDLEAQLRRLRRLAQQSSLGPSTQAIVQAALARGIPARRLNSGSLVQLGYGARQRRILAAGTDRTGAIAESIAQDKELTRTLLRAVGVPVPEGRTVESADDAWAAAQEIGLPVVVKPRFGNQGRGVMTNLNGREQVLAAYAAAREEESTIIVEQFAPGSDYRLLVVGDRLVAAARREPAQVVGDGVHSIEELIGVVNEDPRRGDDHATSLSKIALDAVALQVLADQGLAPASIPPAGVRVLIRRNANLSTGGTAADVTDLVHPEVAARAVEAARVIGLDIAGVDVVATDIGSPLEDQRGMIVEVNAGPGLRMHMEPSAGQPRAVGDAIVGMLFAPGETGRIPIVAVTGVNGKTTTTRLIAHILRGAGRRIGMTCTEGIYIDGRRIQSGDCSGPQSARMCCSIRPSMRPCWKRRAAASCGPAWASIVATWRSSPTSARGIIWAWPISTLWKSWPASSERWSTRWPHPARPCSTRPIRWSPKWRPSRRRRSSIFRSPPISPSARRTAPRGVGRWSPAMGSLCSAKGNWKSRWSDSITCPSRTAAASAFRSRTRLRRSAPCGASGSTREAIRAGLESFVADMQHVPGRFNLLDIGGVTVIVDYGHNPSSLLALTAAMDQFPHERRTAVYTCAGDRRDCDMIRQGELLGAAFDRVVLYEDHYIRGRRQGEIMELLKQGLAGAKRALEVQEVSGAEAAMDNALNTVRPGELLMIQADTIDETVDYVRRYLASHRDSREIGLLDAVNPRHSKPVRLDAASAEAAAVLATQIAD